MPRIKIEGNNKLSGKITISGAKNSAVALIPAAILCDEEVILENVPNITDVDYLENIILWGLCWVNLNMLICIFLAVVLLGLDLLIFI